jgi:hypothetical protein
MLQMSRAELGMENEAVAGLGLFLRSQIVTLERRPPRASGLIYGSNRGHSLRGHCRRPSNTASNSSRSRLTRYGTMYGVPDTTSSRVPAKRAWASHLRLRPENLDGVQNPPGDERRVPL